MYWYCMKDSSSYYTSFLFFEKAYYTSWIRKRTKIGSYIYTQDLKKNEEEIGRFVSCVIMQGSLVC